MLITLVGLNHRTAGLEIRERVRVGQDVLPEALGHLKAAAPEGYILSTCNRFEILARDADAGMLAEYISRQCGIPRAEFESCLYHYSGPEAVRHVFRVAGSLDSMVVGEAQILGQMKQAFAAAQDACALHGGALHSLLERAIAVARKVRTDTGIAEKPVSVSSVAVDLASRVFGTLEQKTALVIGAGKMSTLSVRHLQSHGVSRLLLANRTYEKAVELAGQLQGEAVRFEDLSRHVSESDIVISSTGAPDYVVRRSDVENAMACRKNRPMLLVDLAVPRDIDPESHRIGNVFLYNVDDLRAVGERNREERQREAAKAEALVEKEAELFWKKLMELEAAPAIREIQNSVEELRQREVARSLRALGEITIEQKEGIERLAASIVNKILQGSFCEMKQLACEPNGQEKIQYIRRLFVAP